MLDTGERIIMGVPTRVYGSERIKVLDKGVI